MAHRAIPLVMALLLMLTLLGCEGGGPVPVDPAATATAQVADQATLTARQGLVGTYGVNANVTATAGAVVLARVRPLIGLDLQDAWPIILAGTTFQAVRITVSNRDSAPHHLVIRLYERTAPLNIRAYASSDPFDVPAGGTAVAGANSPLPFASIAAQIQQLDGIVEYGPPDDSR